LTEQKGKESSSEISVITDILVTVTSIKADKLSYNMAEADQS